MDRERVRLTTAVREVATGAIINIEHEGQRLRPMMCRLTDWLAAEVRAGRYELVTAAAGAAREEGEP